MAGPTPAVTKVYRVLPARKPAAVTCMTNRNELFYTKGQKGDISNYEPINGQIHRKLRKSEMSKYVSTHVAYALQKIILTKQIFADLPMKLPEATLLYKVMMNKIVQIEKGLDLFR